jgi:hemolysin activation/secretion protein
LFLGLSENTDFYRHFYEGGDGSFIGYHYDEFSGPNAGYLRIENQFHWNNYLSFLAVFNTGKIWEEYFDINLDQNLTSGFGVGLQINTIIGPFRYLYSISPDHQIQYFNFGFTLATQNAKRR